MNILFHVEGIYFLCYIIIEEVDFMEKNYYKILQIDKNASPEIVEKAYKTLVKMYHPDLQDNKMKQECEKKIKLLNEAYETISDEQKRKQYDFEIEQKKIEQQENIKNYNQNSPLHYYQQNNQPITEDHMSYNKDELKTQKKYEEKIKNQAQDEYNEQLNKAINQAYHDAYIQDLKNRGYKIVSKKTFKDYLLNLVSLIITIFILFLLWQTPFIKNFFQDNIFINTIIETIKSLSDYK